MIKRLDSRIFISTKKQRRKNLQLEQRQEKPSLVEFFFDKNQFFEIQAQLQNKVTHCSEFEPECRGFESGNAIS